MRQTLILAAMIVACTMTPSIAGLVLPLEVALSNCQDCVLIRTAKAEDGNATVSVVERLRGAEDGPLPTTTNAAITTDQVYLAMSSPTAWYGHSDKPWNVRLSWSFYVVRETNDGMLLVYPNEIQPQLIPVSELREMLRRHPFKEMNAEIQNDGK